MSRSKRQWNMKQLPCVSMKFTGEICSNIKCDTVFHCEIITELTFRSRLLCVISQQPICIELIQWRIQDFPQVGAPTLRGYQHTILPNIPENYMKSKEFGHPWVSVSPCAPLRSANVICNNVDIFLSDPSHDHSGNAFQNEI